MINSGKRNVLGVGVSTIDYDAAVDEIINAAIARRPLRVTALAVHGVMSGVSDAQQRQLLGDFDIVAPDGQPVRWALRWLHGERLVDRVYGPELTTRVLERAAAEGIGVYLYGSTTSVLDEMTARLAERIPDLKIAGAEASNFRMSEEGEQHDIAERIRWSGAGIVLVGLGCPRQEIFVHAMAPLVNLPMLAVGAAFDYHAGGLKQPPPWMQRRGLEWLWRLRLEPRRLWRRYVLLNPAYLVLLVAQRSRLWRPKALSGRSPSARIPI